MVTFVFELRADAALMPAALDELRARLPSDVSIIPKTQTALAVYVPAGADVGALKDVQQVFGTVWDVYIPTYAETGPPRLNFEALRKGPAR